MFFEALWEGIQWAWAYAPFPWPFLALILIGFGWLWIEYQTTRLARALPFWRQPLPLLPEISLAFGWVIRICRGLLIFWIILFLVLVANFLAVRQAPDYPPAADRIVTGVGRIWRQGYTFLTDRLPEATPDWLLPPALEEMDLRTWLPLCDCGARVVFETTASCCKPPCHSVHVSDRGGRPTIIERG